MDDKIINLINLKLIFEHGVSHSKGISKLHRMLAIHNCHYVVEQIIREKASDHEFTGPLRKIGFEDIINKINKDHTIPNYNQLIALNKIRNDVQHNNIVPDIDDVRLYISITREFLKWSYKTYFSIDYGSLNLEDRIYDVPIKKVMMEAKKAIDISDLKKSSEKMYEGLGAFKFMWFAYLSDPRVMDFNFYKSGKKIDFPNLLADLAFKIILSEDLPTLEKLLAIGTNFKEVGDEIRVVSSYVPPTFLDKEKAREDYDFILNIILTYQDRVPKWRTE